MKKKKKILIIAGVLILVAAAAAAIVFAIKKGGNSSVVSVYPMELLNNADYMEESGSSLSGTITSEYVQEVYLESGKDIKEVYVKKGDTVKEGDKLLKYNVDEEELDLKLQKLQIQSSTLEIKEMEKELDKLRKTKTVGSLDTNGGSVMSASLNLSPFQTGFATLMKQEETPDVSGQGTTQETKETDSEAITGKTEETKQIPEETTTEINKKTKTNPEETEGEDTPPSESPEELLEKKKTETIAFLEDTLKDASFTYPSDKTTAEAAIKEYKDKINEAGDSETVDSLKEAALKKLSEIKALETAKDEAKKVLTDYLSIRRYGTEGTDSNEAKKEAALKKAQDAIGQAKNQEEIDSAKASGLEELGKIEALYLSITDADEQRALNSGNGEKAEDPIRYLLAQDGKTVGTVSAETISTLMKKEGYAGKYIELRLYEPSGYPAKTVNIFTIKPGMELSGKLKEDGEYTLDELKEIITEPEKPENLLKALDSYKKYTSGKGTSASKYQYYLDNGCLIKGSVINYLIKNKKYALLKEYASEEAFSKGDNPVQTITITPNTLFKETISGTAKYTVSDLLALLVTTDSVSVTSKKKNLKTVEPGESYIFVAQIKGKNTKNLAVTWTVKNNKSKETTIAGGILKVGFDETAKSLKIIATAGGKKGSYVVSVKKQSGGSDTGGSGDSGGTGNGDIGDDGGGDGGGEYTAEELKEEISGKEEELAQAKQDLSEAKINYKEAKKEVDSAVVTATVSGKVTTAYSAGNMPTDGSAAIVVRADSGMYVKASVSEMNLDTVKVGGTLRCTSWETGEEYEAVVKSVSDFPVSGSGSDSVSNPNSSYYPIVAYIKDAEGLTTGETVGISYDSQSMGTVSGDLIVLQKAYIRTEGKKSYVYKAGKNGRLEKQYVKTGTTIYGQYVQIVSGLTLDDKLAFPYGKNVEEGAKVKLSENQEEIIY